MSRIALIFIAVLLPSLVFAAGDAASFESFYRPASFITWWVAGIATIIVVGIVFVTGGTASPLIAWVGTLIGNAMGLSGAAATKAGLAFLGGGSLAAGGFGMVGGTVLLTAALSFSTEVIVDYGVGKAVSEYRYRDLVSRSKNFSTLPLPTNAAGPAGYRAVINGLRSINAELPLHAEGNLALIENAIALAQEAREDASLPVADQVRLVALVSLLKFQTNDFRGAKEYAGRALVSADSAGVAASLPAFIYASSGLYDEKLDFEKLTDTYLRRAVLRESSNKLIPLLFAIYLDRTMLRIDEGDLGPEAFSRVFWLMEDPALEDYRLPNLVALATRYFAIVKLEQQRISSLATTSNDTLRNSPETLERVERAKDDYGQLLADLGLVLETLGASIPSGTIPDWLRLILRSHRHRHRDAGAQFEEWVQLRQRYLDDKDRLGGLISELATYQAAQARLAAEARRAEEARIAEETRQAEESELQRKRARDTAMIWIAGLILVAGVLFVVLRRRRSTRDANLIAVARTDEH